MLDSFSLLCTAISQHARGRRGIYQGGIVVAQSGPAMAGLYRRMLFGRPKAGVGDSFKQETTPEPARPLHANGYADYQSAIQQNTILRYA